MPLYALATIPLINHLSNIPETKQVWYADDASVTGQLSSIRRWWDTIKGYNAKTWLVTKERHLSHARELFQDTPVNITAQGRPYLGTALGSNEFCDQYMAKKVGQWSDELLVLTDMATTKPLATYAAFIHGFVHKFTRLLRTMPCKDNLLQPLEETI